METKKKLVRAKVKLQNEKPFFAYLIMNMRYHEDKNIATMGVNCKGDLYYNPKFIDGITEEELKGVLAHEVMHVVFEHLLREKEREHLIWNIATDLCINDLLKDNDFTLLENSLVTDYKHSYTFNLQNGKSFIIEDINKKNAEQVYQEMLKHKKDFTKQYTIIDGQRFDKHIKTEKGQGISKEEQNAIKQKFKQVVSEASAFARQKGDLPQGIKLLVEELLNEKINWKTLLYKYLTKTIPYDYTYNRPSKRSIASGFYMPIMRKESIEIVVSLDTSGSISKEELQEFMSEINGIEKSFSNLKMKLIICDNEIKDVYTIGNGDNDKINELIIRGGGGTSHKPIYEYIKKELPHTKLLVNFTDGYTDFPKDNDINSLWVICKNGCQKDRIPFGEVIKLE